MMLPNIKPIVTRQLIVLARLLPCLLVLLLLGCITASVAKAQLSSVIWTNKPSYVLGERVEARITVFNDFDRDATLYFSSTLQAVFVIDDEPVNQFGFAVFSETTIPAHGSFDWGKNFSHSLGIGTHKLDGYFAQKSVGFGSYDINSSDPIGIGSNPFGNPIDIDFSMSPIFFDITAPKPVVNDIFIDFETYPDGSSTRDMYGTKKLWGNAYAEWGVRLSTTGYETTSLGINLDDNFGSDNTIVHTYLSKRNARAEFDMPVFEVSAVVGSIQGQAVKMVIFDEQGNEIDSVISDIVSDYPALAGTVKLTSEVPIGAVEWSSFGGVRIDDLYLDVRAVPEPSGVALFAIFVTLFCLQRRFCRSSASHVLDKP